MNDSQQDSLKLFGWCVFAAIAGLCCVILPAYFTKNGISQPAYGWPLIPFFALAWANAHVTVSMICFFVLGSMLGFAEPKWWWLLAIATGVLSPVLLTINILHDWTHDKTSHNLFPFEFLMYAFMWAPVVIGAFLGRLFRRLSQKRRAA